MAAAAAYQAATYSDSEVLFNRHTAHLIGSCNGAASIPSPSSARSLNSSSDSEGHLPHTAAFHSNGHQLAHALSQEELEILQRMEQQNQMIEHDTKSASASLSASGHSGTGSRRSADSDSHSHASNEVQPQFSISEDLQEDLWAIWGYLVKNWEVEFKRRPQYIKDLVKQGIPCHFRTIAWQLLSNANIDTIHEQYAEYMRAHSPHEKVIVRDISRTFPEHEFFRDPHGPGQQGLFNVMKAYSLHDREVGYCQGSAFIAGLLLLQMPEEEAFAVLQKLMSDPAYRLRELYKPAMTELGLCMFQLECMVQEQMSDLFMHFQNMGFDTSMYASSWFLTLFSTQYPLDLANRIMDVILSEGMEMVFRVAMATLQLCRIDLLQLDMEGMLRYFQRDCAQKFEQDHDLLMNAAYQVRYNQKRMKKLEKDFTAKRTKEQDEAIELRRFRTENRLLKQRIEYLEKESEALADRLIQGQVNWAEEAEACISVRQQLLSLKDLNHMAHKQLESAYETIKELAQPRTDARDQGAQVDDREMIDIIHGLQKELMETKTREADNENTIRDLKHRVQELENVNKRLRETPPDHCVATLQEELISVKMREAEASLSVKEMRQKVAELELCWEKYTKDRSAEMENSASSGDSSVFARFYNTGAANQAVIRDLEDQLMGVRIREADSLAELKEMRQKVMELETALHVSTNQLRRQDEEYKKLQTDHDQMMVKEREMQEALKSEQRKTDDMNSQAKEQNIMSRLKETELLQTIAELKNKVAELESKHTERWTQFQLSHSGGMEHNFNEDGEPVTPTSLTSSVHSVDDALSVSSEFDLNDMAVKVPPGFVESVSTGVETPSTERSSGSSSLSPREQSSAVNGEGDRGLDDTLTSL